MKVEEVKEVKENALETVYNAYYDMYMSKAQNESEIIAKMKSFVASNYVEAFTKTEIITKGEAEKQCEAAFKEVIKDTQKKGAKEKARKIMANINAVTKAEIYLDEHKHDMNEVSYYETKLHLTAMVMRMDGVIKGLETLVGYDLLTMDEVANLLNTRKLAALKGLVDNAVMEEK